MAPGARGELAQGHLQIPQRRRSGQQRAEDRTAQPGPSIPPQRIVVGTHSLPPNTVIGDGAAGYAPTLARATGIFCGKPTARERPSIYLITQAVLSRQTKRNSCTNRSRQVPGTVRANSAVMPQLLPAARSVRGPTARTRFAGNPSATSCTTASPCAQAPRAVVRALLRRNRLEARPTSAPSPRIPDGQETAPRPGSNGHHTTRM